MGTSIVAKKKTDRVEFKAEPGWVAHVTAEAERLGMSLSAYVRVAVNEKLARDGKGQDRGGGEQKDGGSG